MLKLESYPGSKGNNGTWRRICSAMPRHRIYLEPFFGSGVIMGRKAPAEYEIGIDIDADVAATWCRRPFWRPGPFVLCDDALRILTLFAASMDPTWFIYVDAPWPGEVRANRIYYKREMMGKAEHKGLLEQLVKLPARMMVSCYWNPLYQSILHEKHGWRAEGFRAATRGGVSQEWLWMNYPVETPLHDLRYVGRNRRERQRINRKRERWVTKFRNMIPAERQVIAEALAEVASAATPGVR